jgi:hypothetical protein
VRKFIAPMVLGFMLATGTSSYAQTPATIPGGSVGYPPARSPFVDLEHAQELTVIGGNYHGHRDPANVAPTGGAILGLHYEWRATGPLQLIAEAARISSERNILNPSKVGAARNLGAQSRALYTADFDLGLGLTGGKSWHHLVPEIATGVGLISNFDAQPDSGGFRFGTRFAFNLAAGLKYVPAGRWQIRADIKDRMYTIAYPETYYIAPSGGTAVVTTEQARSFWTHNPQLTLGLSYLF